MLRNFYPSCRVKNVFQIDYEELYENGYRGILFDIDNTLVHHGDDSTEVIIRNIDTLYVADAGKPNISGYLKAVELLHLQKSECICVGDQIFTDIYGANKCGIDSILVDFIRLPEEKWFGKRRILEKIILKCCDIQRGGKMGLKNFC